MEKKILIWRDGAFGDTILLIPFLKILKQKNFYIKTILKDSYAKIFFYFNLINENIDSSSNELLPLFSDYKEIKTNILNFITDNDLIVIFTNANNNLFIQNINDILKNYSKKTQLIIRPFQPEISNNFIFNENILKGNLKHHKNHIILHFLKSIDITSKNIYLIKKYSDIFSIKKRPTKRKNKKNIIIHIGSGSKNKNISLKFFIKLIKYLKNKKCKISIIGSYAEEKEFYLLQNLFREKLKYHFNKEIIELTKIIQSSSLFIGNESGPAHLSALLNIPTIILCKNIKYKIWHQIGRKTYIIKVKEKNLLP